MTDLSHAGEPTELQRWNGYVDQIDDKYVHLVLADKTHPQTGNHEHGAFPIRLFEDLDIVKGQYLTVRVMSDDQILISQTPVTDEQRSKARLDTEELVDLLKKLSLE